MARSVTPPPLSDRRRLLANSARRRSEVAPLPRAHGRSLEAQSASSSTPRHKEQAREMLDNPDRAAKVEVKSDWDDAGVATPRKWDRVSVKKEPKPSPTSPPLPRFPTKSSPAAIQHPTVAEQQSVSQDSLPRAFRFQTPIVVHPRDVDTSSSRQLMFLTTLVAEPPRKKRRYSVGSAAFPTSASAAGQASMPKPLGLVCSSNCCRDDDGNALVPGKSYFVGAPIPKATDESESTMRRSPRKAKPVEIFSSLHMTGPTRRRRKVSKVTTDLTASQTSRQYNEGMNEQVDVFNNAWSTRFVDPDDSMHGASTSASQSKGKGRENPHSPTFGPTGLKHVLNKAYRAENATQSLQSNNTPYYLDTGTLKWVRRDAVSPGATRLATDPPDATSSVPVLPSPAITPVPEPVPPKRGPGRPRKSSLTNPSLSSPSKPQSRRMSTGRPRGRPRKNPESPPKPKSTGRPRGRPRKNPVSATAHAGGSGRMPDYRLHQSGPDMPPFLVLHEPSVYSASTSQYSLPSASSSHASFLLTSFPSTSFPPTSFPPASYHPPSFPSVSQPVYPAQTQQAYATLAHEEHVEEATPPAPSGTSAGGRDDESDVLSYVDPDVPLSPEIGYIVDTEEELDQQAALDYLLNLE